VVAGAGAFADTPFWAQAATLLKSAPAARQ
jgi:hypothetical protein